MWYRLAIKPDVPEDVFREYVKAQIPRPIDKIETGLGDQHLILTGTGDIHQGVSHSMFLNRILDQTRKSLSDNSELREIYNNSRFPEYAYGPEDLVQRRNEKLAPNEEKMHPEDAVTEILHDYFDQGIRISNMAGHMAVNAIHVPSLMQINKIFEIARLLQPKQVAIKIVTQKGTFIEEYKFDDIADLKEDILDFKMHGPKKHSTMSEWRRY